MSEPHVTVLREIKESPDSFSPYVVASWCGKAADEIERLEAEKETWDGHKVCELLRSDLANAMAEIERLEGERDRQYDQNVEQIKLIAKLEARCKANRDIISSWETAYGQKKERIAKLEAAIEWIGANTDSPATALYCHAALGDKDEA